jgi:hypothetical protein
MSWLTSILVEPFYRLIYGPPLGGLAAQETRPHEADAPRHAGLTIVVGGVGGFDLTGTGMRYVLSARKMPCAVEVFPWGHGFGRWLADLTNVANRDAQSGVLADLVKRFKAGQPSQPVFLVAKSGGCGVAVRALERLDEATIERVVLLAPALSPGYDLTGALRAVRNDLVVFWSPCDVFILGLGTTLLGTIDRVRCRSAGLVGFRAPTSCQAGEDHASAYTKLRQVRWEPRMAKLGNFGGHLGPDSPFFLNSYVAPLLRVDGTLGL